MTDTIDSIVHVRLSDGFHELLEIPAKEIPHHVSSWFCLSDYCCLEVCHMHIDLVDELEKINQNLMLYHFKTTTTCKYLIAPTWTLGFCFCSKEKEKENFSAGENWNNLLGICGLIA